MRARARIPFLSLRVVASRSNGPIPSTQCATFAELRYVTRKCEDIKRRRRRHGVVTRSVTSRLGKKKEKRRIHPARGTVALTVSPHGTGREGGGGGCVSSGISIARARIVDPLLAVFSTAPTHSLH